MSGISPLVKNSERSKFRRSRYRTSYKARLAVLVAVQIFEGITLKNAARQASLSESYTLDVLNELRRTGWVHWKKGVDEMARWYAGTE